MRLEAVAKRTNFYSIRNFNLTYDRHKGAYDFRVRDFPDSYQSRSSPMDYRNDPDAWIKFVPTRLNLKLILLGLVASYYLIQWRVRRVEHFDRMKRKE